MKIVALLPMKGNSERIPNKNLKIFQGKPLYHIIMETLLKSKYISKIIINTDSVRIKNDVKNSFQNKVLIIDRPKEIQGDFISMNEIIRYDIDSIQADIYIQTHSTNPLLKISTIDKAIEKMINRNNKFDSIFSVTKLQTRLYDKNGKPFNHNPNKLIRTQDLPPLFEENSNFYIFTKQSFNKANNNRIGLNPLLYVMDKNEAIDIDELSDFIIAEAIYSVNRQK